MVNETQSDTAYCIDQLKQDAPDLYLASLLLPTKHRDDIIALNAFHAEVINIVLGAREPMAGQVRLQWWVEVIAGERVEEGQGHPIARALLKAIEKHELSRQSLDAKLEAHIFDLYNDPMPDRTTLEGMMGETRSVLFHMAATILGADQNADLADVAGHAGVATGIVSILQNLAMHRALGKVYFPRDLLTASGLSPEQFLVGQSDKHSTALQGMIDLGWEHYSAAIAARGKISKSALPAFKTLALVPLYLKNAAKHRSTLFEQAPNLSQLKKQWVLWRA